MRDYAKVAPQFWTGATGKKLKASGMETVIVAMYLMSSPHANMIGVYYLPELYLAHETGLGIEGASKGLARCIEAGFCTYDEASEYVFVHSMARFQIGESLKADDKRCKGVENELAKVPEPALRKAFIEIYGGVFHLQTQSPIEAPSKPLGSQEQEQEQEQEQGQYSCPSPSGDEPKRTSTKSEAIPYQAIVDGYNATLTKLPKVRELTAKRKTAIRTAWQESEIRRTADFWKSFWEECADDPFLNGDGPYRGEHANWRPSFDYLIRSATLTRVYETAMHRMEAAA